VRGRGLPDIARQADVDALELGHARAAMRDRGEVHDDVSGSEGCAAQIERDSIVARAKKSRAK
jgi:hypothetical protein